MSTWIHMISGWRHQTTRPPLVQPFLLHQNRIRDEDLLLALGLGKKGDEKRGKCLNAPILGKNHCNPHYITTVISTINHWIQPLINQLNAILGAPSCMDAFGDRIAEAAICTCHFRNWTVVYRSFEDSWSGEVVKISKWVVI